MEKAEKARLKEAALCCLKEAGKAAWYKKFDALTEKVVSGEASEVEKTELEEYNMQLEAQAERFNVVTTVQQSSQL